MATLFYVRTLVVFAFVAGICCCANEEENFLEAAKSLMQDHGQEGDGLGALFQTFMESDGAQQLGNMLGGGGKAGGGGADILAGLGSLFASNAGGGLDPELIGNMVEMFTASNPTKENTEKSSGGGEGMNWEAMMNIAGNLLGNQDSNQPQQGGNNILEAILHIVPMLMQSGSGAKSPHHHGESSLPPFMEPLYEVWVHFSRSELFQALWANSGLGNIMELFTKEGQFDMQRIFESLENNTFRRRWIKGMTSFVADCIAHITNPEIQQKYLNTAYFVGNGFLKSNGYKAIDSTRPVDSVIVLVNTIMKKQFSLKVNSGVYIKPAVAYVQDLFKLGKSKGFSLSHLSHNEIESKLAEALNGEVIEPILRVWRAYRYARREPNCDRYVICVVNNPEEESGQGLKPGITKISSLVAAWYLSGNTESSSFSDLYSAVVDKQNCQASYPVDCGDYHIEDLKATTEYSHNEL